MLLAEVTPVKEPLISWDTWGLITIGILVLVLWLAFRRMFPEDGPPKKK